MQYIIVFIIIIVYASIKEGLSGFLGVLGLAAAVILLGLTLGAVLHFLGFNKK